MQINSIKFKNIGPYGNIVQELELNEFISSLINITAKNGSGKSTLLNVISFLLYGKVVGINKSSLVNRINKKGMWGEIKFVDRRGRLIEIVRGISPNKFILTIDSEPYKAAKDKQQYIEEDILNMDINVFTNTISLSVNEFKSFLVLTPQDKRKIIDKLFGFHIINSVLEVIKKRKSSINDELFVLENKLEDKIYTINGITEKIKKLEESSKTNKEQELKSINEQLAKLVKADAKYKTKNSELNIVKDKFNSALQSIRQKINITKTKLDEIVSKIKIFNNDKCPTCETDLTNSSYDHIKDSLDIEKDKLNANISEFNDKLNKIKLKGNKLKEQESKLYEFKTKITSKKSTLAKSKSILSKVENKTTKEFTTLVKQYKKQSEELETNINNKKLKINYYTKMMDSVLSDDGVKNILTKRIVNPLNELVKKNNSVLALDKTLTFDDKFNVTVMHLGQEISPKTLSTGEKKKADLILLLSFLELIKMQMPNLNCLFLDEIFSSLDPENIDKVLYTLRNLSEKFNFNIFIITHAQVEQQFFKKIIRVNKENNFAKITSEFVN